jgi:hypothetical protein
MAASVAVPAITIALDVFQGIISAIPGGIALWQAIVALRTANPGMTAAEALTLMQNMTAAIGALGADEVAQLALIPPVPTTSAKAV